ncbi:MAG: LamG domain-containing protein [Candidatus Heimdallarchaeaceae archaeon]
MYNNKVVNGLCEETIYPHLKDQGYPPVFYNSTWVRSNVQKYSGSYSFLLTKTSGAGAGSAFAIFHPAEDQNKLYGFIPGQTYIFRTQVYVPAGTTPAEVYLQIGTYYSGSWHYFTDYASLNDTWEQLKIIHQIHTDTTGVRIIVVIYSTANIGDKAYFDEIKVQDYNRLIGYWPMDEPNGATVFDMSGEGNDGTLEGTAPTRVTGKVKKCINFPGTDERVDCGNAPPLDRIGNGDFSISFWMKSKDEIPLNYGYLFSKYQNSDNEIGLFSNGISVELRVYIKKGGVLVHANFNPGPFDSIFHHVVIVVNRTTNLATVYFDAQLANIPTMDLSTLPTDCSNTGNLLWGARHDGLFPYEGLLDECRIYSYALTQEEINFLYEHPDGLIDGLLGYWSFNDKNGIYAFDGSAQLNDGTLEGTAPTWVKGKSAGAINFPGTDERVDCGNNYPLNMVGYGDFSISFWMKSKDTVPLSNGCIFVKYQNFDNRLMIRSYSADNQLRANFYYSGVNVAADFNAAPFDTLWNHIVLVINRTIDKFYAYMNGIKDAVEGDISTLPFNISNTGNIAWGAYHDGSGFRYEGLIDEPRIYNRVLTEDEIKFLYEHPGGIKPQTGIQLKIYSISGDLIGFLSDTDSSGSLLKAEVVEKEIGGVEKFSFEIPRDYDIPISGGSECYFYINGTLWFIGYIINLPEKDQTDLILKIEGSGFSKKLTEKIINVTYITKTLSFIIDDIGTTYLGTSVGVYYNAAKIDVPIINDISIEFKDKNLFDVFSELLKIANYDYDTTKYRWYVDNERELVFEEINTTSQETYFEGYDYQSPKVDKKGSEVVNKILAFRTKLADRFSTEYVATYQDTESQGRLGIFEKKMIFPDYADNTTIQNISNSIINQFAYPSKRVRIKDLVVTNPLSFGFYGLANKRDYYWQLLAECDTLTGWDTGNLTVTTFSVSTDKVLTGLRSLKFITADGSLGDYVEYTLDEILYFPVNLRFYIYFLTTAISVKLVFIDKDDAQVEIEAKQITDEWAQIESSIEEVTDLGFMKVSDGFLKVSDGFMKVRHLALAGITSIKKIRIYINSNTVTTFYIDRIEASANMYKYAKLLLKQSNYTLSSLGFFVDAVFGEKVDSIITEIDQRAIDGEIALDIYAKQ